MPCFGGLPCKKCGGWIGPTFLQVIVLVRVICPKCFKRGSMQPTEINGKKYWEVHHSDRSQCYIGRGPVDVDVIDDRRPPVGTRKVTFDDDTDPSAI